MITNSVDNANKQAFSTRCLPGSVAEQKEKERLEEFHRAKKLRQEEEARDKPQRDAERQKEYEAAFEANRIQMRKKQPPRIFNENRRP